MKMEEGVEVPMITSLCIVEASCLCQTSAGWPFIPSSWYLIVGSWSLGQSTRILITRSTEFRLFPSNKCLDPNNCDVRNWRYYVGEIVSLGLQYDSSHVSAQSLLDNMTVPRAD